MELISINPENYNKYIYVKSVLKENEKHIRPKNNKSENKYTNIDENGIPYIGTYLQKGDCIIGKERNTENVSIYANIGEI